MVKKRLGIVWYSIVLFGLFVYTVKFVVQRLHVFSCKCVLISLAIRATSIYPSKLVTLKKLGPQ